MNPAAEQVNALCYNDFHHGRRAARLTDEQRAEIRASAQPVRELAEKYGVTVTTIRRHQRATWYVPTDEEIKAALKRLTTGR